MTAEVTLSPSSVIAEVASILRRSNYQVVDTADLRSFEVEQGVLAEDEFGIVLAIVTETAELIESQWCDYQAKFVEYLGSKLNKFDPKVWEAYMVLLTPSVTPRSLFPHLERIRLDTSQIRKLIITGEQLTALSDIARALLPVLPLDESDAEGSQESLLDTLPDLLEDRGVDRDSLEAVISAYRSQDSLMTTLYKHLFGDAPEES